MKKIILATALLVALSVSSFAKDVDNKLLTDLTTALRIAPHVQWVTTDSYRRAAFNFNGKNTYAYFKLDDEELIGFSIHLTEGDLPKASLHTIQEKYPDWKIVETILFIDGSAEANYFARIRKGNKDIAVKIATEWKIDIFNNMS
jgi:hypothetical protein